jgi:hypothetical protein
MSAMRVFSGWSCSPAPSIHSLMVSRRLLKNLSGAELG